MRGLWKKQLKSFTFGMLGLGTIPLSAQEPALEELSSAQVVQVACDPKRSATQRIDALKRMQEILQELQENPEFQKHTSKTEHSGDPHEFRQVIQDPSLRTLVELLQDETLKVEAVETIAAYGKRGIEALPQLLEYYRKDPALRHAIVWMLGTYVDSADEILPTLIEALSDPALQIGGMHALGEIGSAAQIALPQLLPFLKHKEAVCRLKAVRCIGNIGCPLEAVPELLAQATSGNVEMQMAVLTTLATLKTYHEDVFHYAIKQLEHPEEQIRAAALRSLGGWGTNAQAAGKSIATCMLNDPSRRVAMQAGMTLQQLKPTQSEVLELLQQAIKSSRISVRLQAIRILEEIPEQGESILNSLLDTTSGDTRKQVEQTLARLRFMKERALRQATDKSTDSASPGTK
jgi:HEAT repeat protein